jgi:hypothetical protein
MRREFPQQRLAAAAAGFACEIPEGAERDAERGPLRTSANPSGLTTQSIESRVCVERRSGWPCSARVGNSSDDQTAASPGNPAICGKISGLRMTMNR